MNFIKRLFKKWEVIYLHGKYPPFIMKYRSARKAEEDALFYGFKVFKRKKMEVNFSEKQIKIS